VPTLKFNCYSQWNLDVCSKKFGYTAFFNTGRTHDFQVAQTQSFADLSGPAIMSSRPRYQEIYQTVGGLVHQLKEAL
jgi:hypothetical protein